MTIEEHRRTHIESYTPNVADYKRDWVKTIVWTSIVVGLVAFWLGVAAAIAFAATAKLPRMSCSVSANAPVRSHGAIKFRAGSICSGARYNAYKDVKVCVQRYGTRGWVDIVGGCFRVTGTKNPERAIEWFPSLSPHRYRSYAIAQDSWRRTASGGEVVSSAVSLP